MRKYSITPLNQHLEAKRADIKLFIMVRVAMYYTRLFNTDTFAYDIEKMLAEQSICLFGINIVLVKLSI